MPADSLVIVSDAHLESAPTAIDAALFSFLDRVPALGDALLINGDLFHFWFAYRRAIPRHAFPVAARIAAVARTVPVMIVGGNHDRWGDAFWGEQPGVTFGARELPFSVGGRRGLAIHGDGLNHGWGPRRLAQRIVSHRATSALYRLIHPDLGLPLADVAAPLLGGPPATGERRRRHTADQRSWAERALERDPTLDLLVMGHTHEPALLRRPDGREYVNPGAWAEGYRYAVSTASGTTLHSMDGD